MPQKRTGAVRRRQPRNKTTLSAVISSARVLAAVLVYYFPELETYLTGAPNTDSSAPAQSTQSTDAADCAVYFLDVGQGDSILIQIACSSLFLKYIRCTLFEMEAVTSPFTVRNDSSFTEIQF